MDKSSVKIKQAAETFDKPCQDHQINIALSDLSPEKNLASMCGFYD
jgi:hypothetical protein